MSKSVLAAHTTRPLNIVVKMLLVVALLRIETAEYEWHGTRPQFHTCVRYCALLDNPRKIAQIHCQAQAHKHTHTQQAAAEHNMRLLSKKVALPSRSDEPRILIGAYWCIHSGPRMCLHKHASSSRALSYLFAKVDFPRSRRQKEC